MTGVTNVLVTGSVAGSNIQIIDPTVVCDFTDVAGAKTSVSGQLSSITSDITNFKCGHSLLETEAGGNVGVDVSVTDTEIIDQAQSTTFVARTCMTF